MKVDKSPDPDKIHNRILYETRKRFSEKPIVAFTNSTVFILDFYIYRTNVKPVL